MYAIDYVNDVVTDDSKSYEACISLNCQQANMSIVKSKKVRTIDAMRSILSLSLPVLFTTLSWYDLSYRTGGQATQTLPHLQVIEPCQRSCYKN
jgi:hypothetical protein